MIGKLTICCFLISFFSCTQNKISAENSQIKTEAKVVDDNKYLSPEELNQYISDTEPIHFKEKLIHPFDSLQFNKVIGYEYSEFSESVINHKGEFIKIIEKQKSLNESQILSFTNLVTSKTTYGGVTAACFTPKMSLIFFNDTEKVCIIDICLDCNYLQPTVSIPVLKEAHSKVSELGITYGFSEKGISGIRDLSKELNFIYKDYESH